MYGVITRLLKSLVANDFETECQSKATDSMVTKSVIVCYIIEVATDKSRPMNGMIVDYNLKCR